MAATPTPAVPEPRKGMPSVDLTQDEFFRRFLSQYADPAFAPLHAELQKNRRCRLG